MARINKVYCDKCGKDLTENYIKMNLIGPTKDERGYMIYPQIGRIDLCQECFKKLKGFLGRK